MKITKELLLSIILKYFNERMEISFYELQKKTDKDIKSLQAWSKQKNKRVQTKSFNAVVNTLQDEITLHFNDFSEYALSILENSGINKEYVLEIFNDNKSIKNIIDQLLLLDFSEEYYLQDRIGTENIIQKAKVLLSPFRDYFQVSEQVIHDNENGLEPAYAPLVYSSKYISQPIHGVSQLNYLILKFPNSYHIGILLSNYPIDYSDAGKLDYFSYMIDRLKSSNNLSMILFVTDIAKKSISFSVQSSLMEKHNLFFEFITRKTLDQISIQGLQLQQEDTTNFPKIIDCHKYAQLIFERLMSYLTVISNEIIFVPYREKLHKELDRAKDDETVEKTLNEILISYKERTNKRNFEYYANHTLLKDICQYSYLSRHTIFYERTKIMQEVDKVLNSKEEKLPLVVEICSPNSITTLNIIDRCKKILLFTASQNAYYIMNTLEEKSKHRYLPENVSLRLCHLNPEYMMHQYPEELNGKVNLLVIGYGAGSQISDLTRFIRYAYNWLSENGILFISVYNKDAIVLNKHHIHDQRFEISPTYIADYWTHTTSEQNSMLKRLKAYTPESFQSAFLPFFDQSKISLSTYPYISALIDPSEYSREILDEIREADKLYAKKGSHGQLINLIAHKKIYQDFPTDQSIVLDYLQSKKISFDSITHMLSPDSKSLRRSLQVNDISIANATLLKTVILQSRDRKESKHTWIYAILPYDKRVAFDHAKFELVPEPSVVRRFYQGTISPLTVITDLKRKPDLKEQIYLLNIDCINTEYVVMGSGSNSASVRIKTKDFFSCIINTENILKTNIIE
ncbi:hypothetical protein [Agathobacter rectalis]|jgi:hypothetical protein|uniref:Uncharacterized protein n=1 Tax=Agathobacter rectalis TaxID=39491 RepID=A0A0M6WHE9_9FIRM|nr:hypothetical protein [Agathobacter rectalis]CRL34760.1 hypothetical protein T1815_09181 [Agathobacter rectalis]